MIGLCTTSDKLKHEYLFKEDACALKLFKYIKSK